MKIYSSSKKDYNIFKFFADEHNLILLEDEIEQIKSVVAKNLEDSVRETGCTKSVAMIAGFIISFVLLIILYNA